MEKRRRLLNEYLKNVIQLLGKNIPEDLAHFLNLYDCEILFMLRKLAADIFEKGEQILADKVAYTLSPYQVISISWILKNSEKVKLICKIKFDFDITTMPLLSFRYLQLMKG